MTILESQHHKNTSSNLYEHVVQVMDFLVQNYPREALEKFEEVSYLLKQGDNQKLKQFLLTEDNRKYARHVQSKAKATAKYIEKAQALLEVSANPAR